MNPLSTASNLSVAGSVKEEFQLSLLLVSVPSQQWETTEVCDEVILPVFVDCDVAFEDTFPTLDTGIPARSGNGEESIRDSLHVYGARIG